MKLTIQDNVSSQLGTQALHFPQPSSLPSFISVPPPSDLFGESMLNGEASSRVEELYDQRQNPVEMQFPPPSSALDLQLFLPTELNNMPPDISVSPQTTTSALSPHAVRTFMQCVDNTEDRAAEEGSGRVVYTCNTCTTQVETRYHCTLCEDFDLCVPCFEKSSHVHPMEKLGLDLEDRGAREDASAIKEFIIRCIQSLVHASQCRNANCQLPSCQKMKRVLQHTKQCKKKSNNECPVCKQLIALCCYHAKRCTDYICLVPFCGNFKNRLTLQQLQRETTTGQVHQQAIQREFNQPMANNDTSQLSEQPPLVSMLPITQQPSLPPPQSTPQVQSWLYPPPQPPVVLSGIPLDSIPTARLDCPGPPSIRPLPGPGSVGAVVALQAAALQATDAANGPSPEAVRAFIQLLHSPDTPQRKKKLAAMLRTDVKLMAWVIRLRDRHAQQREQQQRELHNQQQLQQQQVQQAQQQLPNLVDEDWHHHLSLKLRDYSVQKLISAMGPTPDLHSLNDQGITSLAHYARQIEADMYETADSREDYYRRIAQKAYDVRKGFDDKSQPRAKRMKRDEQPPEPPS